VALTNITAIYCGNEIVFLMGNSKAFMPGGWGIGWPVVVAVHAVNLLGTGLRMLLVDGSNVS
jgi:hypothetical protein